MPIKRVWTHSLALGAQIRGTVRAESCTGWMIRAPPKVSCTPHNRPPRLVGFVGRLKRLSCDSTVCRSSYAGFCCGCYGYAPTSAVLRRHRRGSRVSGDVASVSDGIVPVSPLVQRVRHRGVDEPRAHSWGRADDSQTSSLSSVFDRWDRSGTAGAPIDRDRPRRRGYLVVRQCWIRRQCNAHWVRGVRRRGTGTPCDRPRAPDPSCARPTAA